MSIPKHPKGLGPAGKALWASILVPSHVDGDNAMTTQPSYTATYIPDGWGSLVWLLDSNKLASLSDWQAQKLVTEGKAKWAPIHVRRAHHMPPSGDVTPSTDPDTVDVWITV